MRKKMLWRGFLTGVNLVFRYDQCEKFCTDELKLESFLFFTSRLSFIEDTAIKRLSISKIICGEKL